MSDSELSEASTTPVPPDSELEKSLRREVVKAQRAGLEDPTVNSIRAASEEALGLKSGFYKANDVWVARSKQIIKDQFVSLQDETQSSPPPTSKSPKRKKRASEEKEPWPRKRKKAANETEKTISSDNLSSPPSDSEFDSPEQKPKKKQQKGKASNPKKATVDGPDADSEKNDQPRQAAKASSTANATKKTTIPWLEDSDSSLSELLDEAPAPKKRQKQKGSTEKKPGKSNSAKSKAEADVDPDQAEIKRLQGWLVKCGIRKVWGKELKPYETSNAKVKHLKQMLADAGMTGRYSVEKANQIKEARELAADIEAVQEGAERWGAEDDDNDGKAKDDGRPARRLVRGAKNYDFLSSDGEETD
ncbi:uncharacterized protein A1O9_00662 [Exophiala aquamarina CBS 119918]|uniref:Transcriptional regulator n=1 Tax=Exophiala aquamarina CBS 119918 TaxID=1182545 RepID=A0A072PRG1_9EURO|nr:uncharacterized protein A1O9_00662 [Exophiala aquamarina CBS 119918]KEF62689.1 hypothetical protein A1O9_00662 [Exophiala aquamarina CBS 119918]